MAIKWRLAVRYQLIGEEHPDQSLVWEPAPCEPYVPTSGGMRHTSTALYFYGVSKKSLHKPKTSSGNILYHISYAFNYYLQLLCLLFLSKAHLNF
jgi:hypothetical protein